MTFSTRTQTRPTLAFMRLKPASITADCVALGIGLTCSFIVRIVGDIPVGEILLLPLLPLLLIFHGRRVVRPGMTLIGVLMGLWLIGQILSDVLRATQQNDWMRGDARIIFFAIDIVCLTVLLTGNERRKTIFIAAYAVGSLLAVRFQPALGVESDLWKFGYSMGTIMIVVLISSFFYRYRLYLVTAILLVAIMGVNLYENYRSPVLDLLVAAALVMPIVPERIGRLRLLPRAGSAGRIAVLAGLALSAGFLAIALVRLATSTGIIGQEAQEKNQQQSHLSAGILLGGRPEILVSSRAVMDSPILGHGSYAKDMKYTEMLSDIQVENGIQTDLEDQEASQGMIPAHSHLMSTWVQAGIFGAIFWIYILWLVFKGVIRVATLRPPNAPLYAWMLVGFAWDILFSPFGNTARMQEALMLVIILDLQDSWQAVLKVAHQMIRNRIVTRPGTRAAFQPR
ncbi:MAG: O-antigen ligase family protein [Terracidiphilus sp.]